MGSDSRSASAGALQPSAGSAAIAREVTERMKRVYVIQREIDSVRRAAGVRPGEPLLGLNLKEPAGGAGDGEPG